MKKFPMSLLCGIAVILITVILFFVIYNDVTLETIHILALVAIVLAEGITTIYAYCAKGNPRRVAAAVVTSLMIPVSLILSSFYIKNASDEIVKFLGWYFAGMIVVNALALILMMFNSAKTEENAKFQAAKSNILYMRKVVKCVMLEPAAKPYEAKLRAIEDDLHFTNDSVTVPGDAELLQMLKQLQSNIADPNFDTEALLMKIEQKIAQRTIMTSRNV